MRHTRFIYSRYTILLILLTGIGGMSSLWAHTSRTPFSASTQSSDWRTDSIAAGDSVAASAADMFPADTAGLSQINDSLINRIMRPRQQFVPNPQKAMWLALVIPGAGQIYNRKYWKLPIVYGGFLGCVYALTWNGQMYRDYSQAYLDIMDDDPNTKSYMQMLPLNYNIAGREERFKEIFKNKKNFYRKYRDMSIFAMIAVYALSVIDAYVDAELSSFDISKDLSLKIEPAIYNNKGMFAGNSTVGVQCKLNF